MAGQTTLFAKSPAETTTVVPVIPAPMPNLNAASAVTEPGSAGGTHCHTDASARTITRPGTDSVAQEYSRDNNTGPGTGRDGGDMTAHLNTTTTTTYSSPTAPSSKTQSQVAPSSCDNNNDAHNTTADLEKVNKHPAGTNSPSNQKYQHSQQSTHHSSDYPHVDRSTRSSLSQYPQSLPHHHNHHSTPPQTTPSLETDPGSSAVPDFENNQQANTLSTCRTQDRPTAATAAALSNPLSPTSLPHGSSTIDIITNSPLPSTPHDQLKRSATYPQVTDTTEKLEDSNSNHFAVDAGTSTVRRAPASRSSLGTATTDGPPPSLRTQRTQPSEGSWSSVASPDALSPRSSSGSQGQRELLLLKSLSQSSPPEERRASTHRPPVSFKPPANATGAQANGSTPVRVPPIRSFRSSVSRKSSLTLDMNYTPRPYESGDDQGDANYDRTLRALEGKQIQDMLQMTPPTSARYEGREADDGGDVFLRIAREEGARRNANDIGQDETRSSVSRVYRSHRRPMSTHVASYQPQSPPSISRRLSDQQDNARPRLDDDRASEVTRSLTQRAYHRDQKAASIHPGDDTYRSRNGGVGLRPSPLTPRSLAYHDPGTAEYSLHTRRRSSITDHNTPPPARSSTHKHAGSGPAYGKSYNSSPLIRSFDTNNHHQHTENAHVVEGTESTASTTAPSTVWDELDDLKSRIHRLELTGKLPSTSAAAVSRLSDDRPPTATTTVTTMSSSPKRSGGGTQNNEAASTASSQKDAYPILHSALSKSKPFLSQDIFGALEAAALDAISLSSLMGQPGQPGPISSGASTIGSGTTVTDRQLRRKADSVCRSLTELCVALGENIAHAKPAHQQPHTQAHAQKASHGQELDQSQAQAQSQIQTPSQTPTQNHTTQQHQALPQQPQQQTGGEGPSTPTIGKTYSGLHSRRASMAAYDQSLPKPVTSPSRTLSKFEERRNTILNGSALPSPRAVGSTPTTPQDTASSRRSSLLISRTRRAVTEEPEEDTGRKSSLLLRSRRGGTEEPEEQGRQTSMLRSRRGTHGEADEEARYSAPSRAYTEVNTIRGPAREYTEVAASARVPTREYAPQLQYKAQDSAATVASSPSGSALPRRRFISTNSGNATSRLTMPSTPSSLPTSALPTRKYLERSATVSERGEAGDQGQRTVPVEDRPQRYHSVNQNTSINRNSSISTRRANRDSTITNSSTIALPGGYR